MGVQNWPYLTVVFTCINDNKALPQIFSSLPSLNSSLNGGFLKWRFLLSKSDSLKLSLAYDTKAKLPLSVSLPDCRVHHK